LFVSSITMASGQRFQRPYPFWEANAQAGWISELFITMLDENLFLVEDVLDLSHGCGASAQVLADEHVEASPDRWCSSTAYGQELWQIGPSLRKSLFCNAAGGGFGR
jgi:hypothetical protein